MLVFIFWLSNKNFQVDPLVEEKYLILEQMQNKFTITNYQLPLSNLTKKKIVIIKSLNTSLILHFQNIVVNPNLLASHILCPHETRIQNIHAIFLKSNVI